MARKMTKLTDLKELRKAVDSISAERKEVAESLIREIVFLDVTLETLRANITSDGPIIESEKQEQRENPALKAYNSTIQRYSLLFKQIVDLLPEPKAEQPTDPLTDFIKQG